jgi:WD40 repeat protein
MKIASLLLAVVLVACATFTTWPACAEEKPVTLAWFPAFSPDATWLVTPHGSWKPEEGGEVRVWNVETGKAKHVIPSPRGVRTVAWSPKGTFFASGNSQGDLRLYDPETAMILAAGVFGGSVGLADTPDEKSRLASGNGQSICGTLVTKAKLSFPACTGICGWVGPDGKTLAAGKTPTSASGTFRPTSRCTS